jgi:hypothetical protein
VTTRSGDDLVNRARGIAGISTRIWVMTRPGLYRPHLSAKWPKIKGPRTPSKIPQEYPHDSRTIAQVPDSEREIGGDGGVFNIMKKKGSTMYIHDYTLLCGN